MFDSFATSLNDLELVDMVRGRGETAGGTILHMKWSASYARSRWVARGAPMWGSPHTTCTPVAANTSPSMTAATKEDSFMVKHQMEEHQDQGARADVSAKVTGVYSDCLTRQIAEK